LFSPEASLWSLLLAALSACSGDGDPRAIGIRSWPTGVTPAGGTRRLHRGPRLS